MRFRRRACLFAVCTIFLLFVANESRVIGDDELPVLATSIPPLNSAPILNSQTLATLESKPVILSLGQQHVALRGECTEYFAPIRARDRSAPASIPCPIRSDLLSCRGASGWPISPAMPHTLTSTVEAHITTALATANTSLVVNLLRQSCEWQKVSDLSIFRDPWPAGQALRNATDVQMAVDCSPPRAVSVTLHHESTQMSGLKMLLHVAPEPRAHTSPVKMEQRGELRRSSPAASFEFSSRASYVSQTFPGKTLYERRHRAAFIRIDNICMTCEAKNKKFFMNTKRPCVPTLWSIGQDTFGLDARSRKGRHGIFVEREGAFQYGGWIDSPLNVAVMRGTTFYLSPFENDNVGHILHDGLWATFGAIVGRHKAGFPKPYHAMMDDHFFNHSSRYYAELLVAATLAELGNETLAGEPLNRPRRDGATPPIIGNPTSYGTEKMVCFETLIMGGMDRNGHGLGRYITREEVSLNLRDAVLRFFNINDPGAVPLPERPPRVFVYGRNEVYRRRINNIGALASALHTLTESLHLPPPVVITSFYMDPASQIELMTSVDVLVSMQGAHLEQSMFMPLDAAIIEIADCRNGKLSFISRYHPFHTKQSYRQLAVCHSRINFSHKSEFGAQDLIVCPHHIHSIVEIARAELVRIRAARRQA